MLTDPKGLRAFRIRSGPSWLANLLRALQGFSSIGTFRSDVASRLFGAERAGQSSEREGSPPSFTIGDGRRSVDRRKSDRHTVGPAVTNHATIYVIACLEVGGAQTGLLRLVELGFLDPPSTYLLSLGPADPSMRRAIERCGPWAGLTILERGWPPLRWAVGAVSLVGLLVRYRPSSAILSLEPANLVGRFLRPFFPKTIFCSFEHSSRYRRRLYRILFPLLARCIDVVLYDSMATRRGIEPCYRRSRPRWFHVPLFLVDPTKPTKADWTIGDVLRLLSVGRLVPAKNPMLLLDIVAELRRRGIEVYCEIVGEGPLRAELERRLDALGLRSAVRLVGQDTAWRDRAPSFDVYVQTSEHEGACLTVLEAMQAGLPVVATAAGEIPDHLSDGAGIVVEPPTADAFADAIEQLAQDASRRRKLGRTASARVAECFDRRVLFRTLSSVRSSLESSSHSSAG